MKRANLAAGPSSISDDDECDVEFCVKKTEMKQQQQQQLNCGFLASFNQCMKQHDFYLQKMAMGIYKLVKYGALEKEIDVHACT